MLSVIGLQICSTSVNNTDVLDYLMYNNKPITFNIAYDYHLIAEQCLCIVNRLLIVNHFQRSEVNLMLLNEISDQKKVSVAKYLEGQLVGFLDKKVAYSLVDALSISEQQSVASRRPVLILSLNQHQLDGVNGLLVCAQHLAVNNESRLSACHVYAEIDAITEVDTSITPIADNISAFMNDNQLNTAQIESMVIRQVAEKTSSHQRACLKAFESLETKAENEDIEKSTLLIPIDNLEKTADNFSTMLSLFASVLCLDQHYRLASNLNINEQEKTLQCRWQRSVFYCLPQSTSYLTSKDINKRHLMVSCVGDDAQQLLLLSKVKTHSIENGFLAQQRNKPIMFKASSILNLQQLLKQSLLSTPSLSFNTYCEKQYRQVKNIKGDVYCLVLVACSFTTLFEQIKLAFSGVLKAVENKKPWKTPQGSYFSGQLIDTAQREKPVSFVFPGVGALYVGMGQDLLRLFPAAYQVLTAVSDNLAFSLQDKLITPRLLTAADIPQKIKSEKLLRSELANLAEAGVSYACLLTTILQQLDVTATSAAGYSMGEISMFAALGCWQSPQLMSRRLRQSPIFTEQLAGELKRLDCFGLTKEQADWESYHLKASVNQIEAVLHLFPGVYITIINTQESLVIAGIPEQCLALAKQLKIRAVALNIPNIIHCDLAKNEYKNMSQLYSLPVNKSVHCKLYSSSCYLPIPITEKAIAVSISKCLTEQVDFPRLIKKLAASGESIFIEIGAGKSLSTWIERILRNNEQPVTCLSVDQKNTDNYQAILKTIAPLISLGYPINLHSFFTGTLIRPVKKSLQPF